MNPAAAGRAGRATQFPPASVEAILDAVHALDAAAAADAWDEAMELEAHCRALLEVLLAGPADPAHAEAIENVAIVYRRVIGMAESCRAAVATELSQLRRGRQGARAYDREGGA